MEALIQQANATPRGQKKTYSSIEAMPKGYHPRFVEAATCVFLHLEIMLQGFPLMVGLRGTVLVVPEADISRLTVM